MINLPSDYDSARAYTGGSSFPTLPVGPHICKIIGARVEESNGNNYLAVAFDIAEGGPDDGYYAQLYDRKKQFSDAPKWPGRFSCPLTTREGKTNGRFKGFITSVEESNPPYNFKQTGGDETTLKGKLVGFNFGEEEWRRTDGKVVSTAKPFYAVSVAKVREGIEPPEARKLNDNQAQMERQGFKEVDETDELPF